ncbi:MAG: DUF1674 domain-containing protein [Alphaproteobacteria bacterium]|nr:DUF1674 domain-containing protein [Alphaproteobacteria bacterium]
MDKKKPSPLDIKDAENSPKPSQTATQAAPDDEIGGYKALGLPEPTRYKDWEVKGRCSDF